MSLCQLLWEFNDIFAPQWRWGGPHTPGSTLYRHGRGTAHQGPVAYQWFSRRLWMRTSLLCLGQALLNTQIVPGHLPWAWSPKRRREDWGFAWTTGCWTRKDCYTKSTSRWDAGPGVWICLVFILTYVVGTGRFPSPLSHVLRLHSARAGGTTSLRCWVLDCSTPREHLRDSWMVCWLMFPTKSV